MGRRLACDSLGNVGQQMVYRIDWFKEAGYDKFPETWDELLEAGTKLKSMGRPFGFEYGYGFGDNHGWMYPLLWSYGAREVDKYGKTIVLDSAETAKSVDWARSFFEKTQLQDVLGWTDVNNNRAFLAEQVSCTNNATSILQTAQKEFPKLVDVIGHAPNPKGPSGERFSLLNSWSFGAFTFSPDSEGARNLVKFLAREDVYGDWIAAADGYYAPFLKKFDIHPMWAKQPKFGPYRESVASAHLPGWPAAEQPGRLREPGEVRHRQHVPERRERHVHEGGRDDRDEPAQGDLRQGVRHAASTPGRSDDGSTF